MGAVEVWLWDDTDKIFCKALCDSEGKLIISDADPFTIAQATPENLKHVPHGYYAAGEEYLPFAVDEDGIIQMAYAGSLALGDLSDVNVPSPTDGYVLTWDSATGLWIASAIPAAAWADITGKPTSPSLEEMANEHNADGTHSGAIVLAASDIPNLDAAKITTGTFDAARLSTNIKTVGLVFIIDGGGSAITTGEKGHLEVPFACTITGWTILADQSGSIVVDVWKDTYANFPPTVADTIAGSEKPTLSSAQKNQDLTLTTWTTAVSAGDILAFNVDSASTVTRVTIVIRATKT